MYTDTACLHHRRGSEVTLSVVSMLLEEFYCTLRVAIVFDIFFTMQPIFDDVSLSFVSIQNLQTI